MAPSDRGWNEIHIAIALSVITTVVVGLRFAANLVKKLRLEVDDWLAIASLIFIYGMFVELILWAMIGNTGKHFKTLITNPPEIEKFFKIFLSQEYTYAITSPLVKLTLLFFYRRLFTTRNFRIAADIVTGVCIAWGLTTVIVDSVQCVPLEKYWNNMIDGKCINEIKFVQGIQGINVVLDLVILVMPVPMVWGLKRPWQDRVALLAVFLLGGFVCGASIYRLVALFQIDASDITYSIHDALVWTFVEPCIGLVCACLPIIRGLFPTYKHNTAKSYPYKGTANSNQSWRRGPFSAPSSHATSDYLEMKDSRRTSGTSGENLTKPVIAHDDRRIHIRTDVDVV